MSDINNIAAEECEEKRNLLFSVTGIESRLIDSSRLRKKFHLLDCRFLWSKPLLHPVFTIYL